jgi:hypothetical protein
MEEVWKKIENFDNYSVSTFGQIRNDQSGKIMKLNNKGGYLNASLTNLKNKKCFKVHRLVALAFIDNLENKAEVNHKDKNKHNNNISNLEWNTHKENSIHRVKNFIFPEINKKVIFRLDKETNEMLEKYDSMEKAAEWIVNQGLTKNIHNGRNAISNSVNGLSKISYGYKWRLKENIHLENEIWKQVPNTIKTYFVSNLGRFKNASGMIVKNMTPCCNGYLRVTIDNKVYKLHRIVALTFIENPNNKEHVNHKDGNKINNRLDNLEWVTNQENQIHKFQSGLGNSFKRKIVQYTLEGKEIKHFDSIVQASNELTIGKSNIKGVLSGNRKTTGGFIFKYAN